MGYFAGKLVLITGASSGVGWQTALDFAAQGANLMLVARRQERLEELAQRLRHYNRQVQIMPCDLADAWSRDRLISDLLGQNHIPDILINNAGFGNYRPFLQETPASLAEAMAVNYQAAAHLMISLLPEMIRRGSGAIVNVSSSAGKVAIPFMAPYCAAKFALCALTEAVSYELADSGITVHLVNPGPIDTAFFEAGVWLGKRPEKKATAQQVSAAIQQAILKKNLVTYVPAKRGILVYVFHLLGPLGRIVLRRKARHP